MGSVLEPPLWGELPDDLAVEAHFSEQERCQLERLPVLDGIAVYTPSGRPVPAGIAVCGAVHQILPGAAALPAAP